MIEVSIGDYVLSGGEPAALVLLDACVRLLPGVMGAAESGEEESFCRSGLLEYPHYTRPTGLAGPRRAAGAALRPSRRGRALAPGQAETHHPRAPPRALGAHTPRPTPALLRRAPLAGQPAAA